MVRYLYVGDTDEKLSTLDNVVIFDEEFNPLLDYESMTEREFNKLLKKLRRLLKKSNTLLIDGSDRSYFICGVISSIVRINCYMFNNHKLSLIPEVRIKFTTNGKINTMYRYTEKMELRTQNYPIYIDLLDKDLDNYYIYGILFKDYWQRIIIM